MIWRRTTTLGVSVGSVVALLAAASTPGVRPAETSARPAASPPAPPKAPITVEFRRLERAAARNGTPLASRRNLFSFAAPAPTIVDASPAALQTPPAVDDAPPLALSPAWELIGIADPGEGDRARTAILKHGEALHFATAGELLPDGWRIVGVGEDSTELRSGDDPPVVLTLPR
jgi:hypothetical protein